MRPKINILILHDDLLHEQTEVDENINKIYLKLKKELKKKEYKKYNFSIIEKDEVELENIHLVILLSNNIAELLKKYNIEKLKKNTTTIFVITGGLKTDNVTNAVNLTPYVFYINKKIKDICYKIIEIMKIKGRLESFK